jgi:mono/diheme cytochrome c family protein
MSDTAQPSWRKTALFFTLVTLMIAGAVAMSVYKIAVVNAYVTLKWPSNPDAVAQPARGDVARGAHVAALVGCADCHGADYGGRELIHEPGYATIVAPNLTGSPEGRGAQLDDASLARVLQGGLDGEHRILWAMPRHSLTALAQTDVWALVAFLRALPPVHRTHPRNRLDFGGYIDVARRRLRIVDRTPIPLYPPKIPRPAVGLDNAAVSFGAEPVLLAKWRQAPPPQDAADFGTYVRALTHCGACHGNAAPLLGRTQAPPLQQPLQDLTRCLVGERLSHLTSPERAAIFDF